MEQDKNISISDTQLKEIEEITKIVDNVDNDVNGPVESEFVTTALKFLRDKGYKIHAPLTDPKVLYIVRIPCAPGQYHYTARKRKEASANYKYHPKEGTMVGMVDLSKIEWMPEIKSEDRKVRF